MQKIINLIMKIVFKTIKEDCKKNNKNLYNNECINIIFQKINSKK
jgi:hypothetical protein